MLYRAGYEVYLLWAAQEARIVGPLDTATPGPIVCTTPAGPGSSPGLEHSRAQMPVQLAGEGYDAHWCIGREAKTIACALQVADWQFLSMAVRDHTVPRSAEAPYGDAPSCRGLPYFAMEMASDELWGEDALATQYVDCLVAALSLDYDEGKPVTATVDVWPTAGCPVPQRLLTDAPSGDVYEWRHLDVEVDGQDLRDLCYRVGVHLRHQLDRKAWRGIIMDGDTETALSRAPRLVTPTRQQLDVTLHFYRRDADRLPASWDWGDLSLQAARHGGGTFEVVVDGQHLTRSQEPATTPGGTCVYTTSLDANVLSITGT